MSSSFNFNLTYMTVQIIDYDKYESALGLSAEKLAEIFDKVISYLDFSAVNEKLINVAFVSSEEISSLNLQLRGKESATDVISLEINEADLLGEIYISIDYIKELLESSDVKSKSTLKEEVVRVFLHGVLHLIGHEHEEHVDYGHEHEAEDEMLKAQEEIMSKIKSDI